MMPGPPKNQQRMKPPSPFEPYLELRPEAFTAPLSEMTTVLSPTNFAPRQAWGNPGIDLPELGGSSFTDTNPWPHGGINE